jgi:hypothetical protein
LELPVDFQSTEAAETALDACGAAEAGTESRSEASASDAESSPAASSGCEASLSLSLSSEDASILNEFRVLTRAGARDLEVESVSETFLEDGVLVPGEVD